MGRSALRSEIHGRNVPFPNELCANACIHGAGLGGRRWESLMNLYSFGARRARCLLLLPFGDKWGGAERKTPRFRRLCCEVRWRRETSALLATRIVRSMIKESWSFSLVNECISRQRRCPYQLDVAANASCGTRSVGTVKGLTRPFNSLDLRLSHTIRREITKLGVLHQAYGQQCCRSHASSGWGLFIRGHICVFSLSLTVASRSFGSTSPSRSW